MRRAAVNFPSLQNGGCSNVTARGPASGWPSPAASKGEWCELVARYPRGVPYYDNPAGRLHQLLRELSEQNPDAPLIGAWSHVLGVPPDDVILHIGGVADLVRQIQEAVDGVGAEYLRAPVSRYRKTWASPIFPRDHMPKQPLKPVLPSSESLEALELVSAQLHMVLPEGVVPDGEELDRLREQLQELAASVRQADDLPDDVKQAIIARLLDVEKAIQHVHVGGPDAVRLATDAVMGTVLHSAMREPSTAASRTMRTVLGVVAAMSAVFSQGDEIHKDLVGWSNMVHTITTGEIVDDGKDNKGEGDEPDDQKKPPGKAEPPKAED